MFKVVILLHLTLVFSEEIVSNRGLHSSFIDSLKTNEFNKGSIVNKVFTDMEKLELKPKVNLKEAIKPLDPVDVKCLMSADKYCSEDMRQVKEILIRSLKNNCEKCSADFKERAGRIAVAMMAHDPVAWKLFFTRYYELDDVQKMLG